jgi:O-methyltransferase
VFLVFLDFGIGRALQYSSAGKSLMNPLKAIVRALIPKSILSVIDMYRHRTFFDDGLITWHIADFMHDPAFLKAYRAGENTGSWNGCNPVWRVNIACTAAKHALSLLGDFVECGVNRGGMSRSIIEYIDFGKLTDRKFYLLDTYKGHRDVIASQQRAYQECYEDVVKTFATFRNVKLVRGTVPETLSLVASQKICFLSIDMNNAAPEIAAVRFFWPKLVTGAIVLLDDYSFSEEYRAQKTAFDDLAQKIGFAIFSLPTGQGMIVKP